MEALENHILRAIDFSFIYEEVEGVYSEKERRGIAPVSLFKIVFMQYLFGIRSMRQTVKESEITESQNKKPASGYSETGFVYKLNPSKCGRGFFIGAFNVPATLHPAGILCIVSTTAIALLASRYKS